MTILNKMELETFDEYIYNMFIREKQIQYLF